MVKEITGAQNKGKKLEVEPVRKIKDIQTISKFLESNPRDHLLWVMGINNGLRASDLVKIKYEDVMNLKAGDMLPIREQKTGKPNILAINKVVYKAISAYSNTLNPAPGDYLFKSRKGENNHISSATVGKMIAGWCKAVNVKGNYGAHTLRKTWGYHQRVNFHVGFDVICKRYNHSSPAITMRYLGIEDKEIHSILMNEIG